jgi:hypothetical protein
MQIHVNHPLFSKLAAHTEPPLSSKRHTVHDSMRQSVVVDDDFGKLLEIVQNASEDRTKVEQARRDMQNGLLDTEQAYLDVAEDFIRQGI